MPQALRQAQGIALDGVNFDSQPTSLILGIPLLPVPYSLLILIFVFFFNVLKGI